MITPPERELNSVRSARRPGVCRKFISVATLLSGVTSRWGALPSAESHLTLGLNPAWRFQVGDAEGSPVTLGFDDTSLDIVSLPHTHQLFSQNLAGLRENGRGTGWYRRELNIPKDWLAKKVFLESQGAMQATTLWVNGKEAGTYAAPNLATRGRGSGFAERVEGACICSVVQ